MIDVVVNKFLWSFSLVSFLVEFLVRKVICMALGCTSSSSSSSWINFQFSMDRNSFGFGKTISQGLLVLLESPQEDSQEEKLCLRHEEVKEIVVDGISLKSHEERYPHHQNPMIHKVKVASKIRKRPTRLVVPESFSGLEQLGEVVDHEPSQKDFQMEGKDFCMASRRGRKNVMEDGYGVLTDIMGDSKQAFFGVFDGHGGRAAVDFVADNLGKNIVSALVEIEEAQDESREAIKKGYLVTDRGFLSQDVSSGACAATALVKNGNLYVANVGDCRVVLSREGVATALTSDHRLEREDERSRIEDMGGYVNCQNGVWRVQGSLAVSRAIGDLHLKQWVISEPEIKMLELTSDCEFLVIASDGLWDKVSNQEAVDMVVRDENSIESCKKLVDVSSSRGNRDDITVMVVDLQNFKRHKG